MTSTLGGQSCHCLHCSWASRSKAVTAQSMGSQVARLARLSVCLSPDKKRALAVLTCLPSDCIIAGTLGNPISGRLRRRDQGNLHTKPSANCYGPHKEPRTFCRKAQESSGACVLIYIRLALHSSMPDLQIGMYGWKGSQQCSSTVSCITGTSVWQGWLHLVWCV